MLKCETYTYVVRPTDCLRLEWRRQGMRTDFFLGGGRLGNDTSEYRRGDQRRVVWMEVDGTGKRSCRVGDLA